MFSKQTLLKVAAAAASNSFLKVADNSTWTPALATIYQSIYSHTEDAVMDNIVVFKTEAVLRRIMAIHAIPHQHSHQHS